MKKNAISLFPSSPFTNGRDWYGIRDHESESFLVIDKYEEKRRFVIPNSISISAKKKQGMQVMNDALSK